MPRLVVVGNSHAHALLRAFEANVGDVRASMPAGLEVSFVLLTAAESASLWRHAPTGLTFEEAQSWHEALARLVGEAEHVAVQWAGNQLNIRALLASGRDFDVVLPGRESGPRGGAPRAAATTARRRGSRAIPAVFSSRGTGAMT